MTARTGDPGGTGGTGGTGDAAATGDAAGTGAPDEGDAPGGQTPPEPARSRRRGRPASTARAAGEPAAWERILRSARTEFAARGFDAASIRGIARGAEVDPALVHHYYGSKEGVFAAAVENAFAPAMPVPERIAEAGIEHAGENMVRFLLGMWEEPATREPLLAIMRSAVNNETAAGIFRDLISREMMSRLARTVPGPEPEKRITLAAAQLVGTALMRYVVRIEPLASMEMEELTARLTPVVQRYLTGETEI